MKQIMKKQNPKTPQNDTTKDGVFFSEMVENVSTDVQRPAWAVYPAVCQWDCKCVLAVHQGITFRRKINSVVTE